MTERTDFSFVPTAKDEILDCLEEKYKDYKTPPGEKEIYVERYYQFEDKSDIRVYKDKEGKKVTIFLQGRERDYQELREKDMRLNREPVEESKADAPSIAELNFHHQTIGSDETGNGETFKNLVVTAAYVGAENEIRRFIGMGVDDSKRISRKIPSIGKEVTGIDCWEEIKDKTLLCTDRFVTRIITNEEYNRRCYENGENKNDVIKEAHLQVLREVYKRNPGSMIVVDDFYDGKEQEIEDFKRELSSGDSAIDPTHVFMTVKADFKIMAVSLASVISAYICNLYCDYVQGILNREYKRDSEEQLALPKNPGADELSVFLFKLKPERKEEFMAKYAKNFGNVQDTMKKKL
ncbi:MAG: hypothetical protein HFH24_04580 [Ruminococcus sp.]|nr:hypothetical protein [Ruminococcus sp.]